MRFGIFDELFRDDLIIDRPPDFSFYVASRLVALAPCNDCSDIHFEYRRVCANVSLHHTTE